MRITAIWITILEMGLVGFAFLAIFIMATLHAFGRLADRDPARHVDARPRFVVGGVFRFAVAKIMRCGRLYELTRVTYVWSPQSPATPGLSQGWSPPGPPQH